MRLNDGARHFLATGLASGAFLALFFGAQLVWWLALAMGVAVYGAALLIVDRKTLLHEMPVARRVTAADIAQAADALDAAGKRLDQSAEHAPQNDAPTLRLMSEHLASIRKSVMEDPDDFRAARQFINVYLPKIVQTVEGYVKVAEHATGDSADRLAGLGERIRGFEPVMHRMRTACIENDLAALEVEVDVLSQSLDRK